MLKNDPANILSCARLWEQHEWKFVSQMSVLPRNFLDKALHRDGELPEEAFDNGSTFRKFVLHFDVEDICHQGHKRIFLPRERGKNYR